MGQSPNAASKNNALIKLSQRRSVHHKHGAKILNYAAVKGVKIKKLSKEEFA